MLTDATLAVAPSTPATGKKPARPSPPEPARYAVSCFVMATVTRACARCMALNARR